MIDARYPLLTSAATVWDETAATVRSGRTSLEGAEPALLGTRVAPSASTFLAAWEAELLRITTGAEHNAEALRAVVRDFALTDSARAAEATRLLPHGGGL